jgi:hypothetical protein
MNAGAQAKQRESHKEDEDEYIKYVTLLVHMTSEVRSKIIHPQLLQDEF